MAQPSLQLRSRTGTNVADAVRAAATVVLTLQRRADVFGYMRAAGAVVVSVADVVYRTFLQWLAALSDRLRSITVASVREFASYAEEVLGLLGRTLALLDRQGLRLPGPAQALVRDVHEGVRLFRTAAGLVGRAVDWFMKLWKGDSQD